MVNRRQGHVVELVHSAEVCQLLRTQLGLRSEESPTARLRAHPSEQPGEPATVVRVEGPESNARSSSPERVRCHKVVRRLANIPHTEQDATAAPILPVREVNPASWIGEGVFASESEADDVLSRSQTSSALTAERRLTIS